MGYNRKNSLKYSQIALKCIKNEPKYIPNVQEGKFSNQAPVRKRAELT